MGERAAEITPKVMAELFGQSSDLRRGLRDVYHLLPETRCQRRALCCSLPPEMTLLEALTAVEQIAAMAPCMRMEVARGFIRYFLTNPVALSSCPFLHGTDCRIYQGRFFGCRAYGLWSRAHYEGEAARNRQAKEVSRRQWEQLGVRLPREVVEFQLPYCPHVEAVGEVEAKEGLLLEAQDRVEALSRRLGFWHEVYRATYFADVSFLLASFAFGLHEAVATKFSLVRDLVNTGEEGRLAHLMEEVPDICARLV
jgi:Fe-S-cluster containining protein